MKSDEGIFIVGLILLLPLLIIISALAMFAFKIKVYTDRVEGVAACGALYGKRRFSVVYYQILNVDIYKSGILLITQYDKYYCPMSNREHVRQAILEQRERFRRHIQR